MSESLYDYIVSTGVIVTDSSTIKAEVQSEFTTAFGAGLSLDDNTPQGILIAAETLARSGVIENNAALANQINPNQAFGVFLDGVASLSGLDRSPSEFTHVAGVVLAGVPNSPIPAGAVAATAANDRFALDSAVTLDAVTGLATGSFTAVIAGPVPSGIGTLGLTQIITDVLGWETITTPVAGILGSAQQDDETFRALRRQTLALQGVGLMEAVLSAVSALPGVVGRQGLENYTNAQITIGGVVLKPNSIWVCVDGGNEGDIAMALLKNKSQGCDWNGNIVFGVMEPTSKQQYTVRYDVPTLVQIMTQITVKQNNFVGDVTSAVTQAVIDFSNNTIPNLQGFYVGVNASPFEIAAAIMQECPGLYVKSVGLYVSGSSGGYQPNEIAIGLSQKAQIIAANISIVLTT